MLKTKSGFTLVELLIVIVVIGILAAITLVAYNGVQGKARDSTRQSAVQQIVQALQLYYTQNGSYPTAGCSSSCTINTSWSDTNDGSWQNLANQLVPQYISSLPSDPNPSTGLNPLTAGNYGFAYFSNINNPGNNYCGVQAANQMYILVYQLESVSASGQPFTQSGACTSNALGPYSGKANYRVAVGGS